MNRRQKREDERWRGQEEELGKTLEVGFHLPFPRGSYNQDEKKGRKGGRNRGKEERKWGWGAEREREKERTRAYTLHFIINIAFSLSRTALLLNFALASPQIIRLFYQSKSINRNLISIDRIKGR